MDDLLPEGFADLGRFGPKWFADSEKKRHQIRINSQPEELVDLYDSLLPRFDQICAVLDQFPLDDLPDIQSNLLNLTLSFMEVSLAVESFHGAAKVPYGFDTDRWEVHF